MAALPGFLKFLLSSIFYINLCLHMHLVSAQTYLQSSCNNTIGSYNKNSTFQANLKSIFSSIAININTYGFYNGTASDGDGIEQVNAMAFCRADIDIESCGGCVNQAAYKLTFDCPYQKEAIMWFYECMFRYSNNSILGIMSTEPAYLFLDTNKASNVTLFNLELNSFAGMLISRAYNDSPRKYAASNISIPEMNTTIYAYMQCAYDITPSDCMSCLNSIVKPLSKMFYNRMGATALSPSCSFRYESYPFLVDLSNQTSSPATATAPALPPVAPPSPSPSSSSSTTPTTSKGKRSKLKTIDIVVFVIVSSLVSTLCAFVFVTKRRWHNTSRGNKLKEKLKCIGDTETKKYDFYIIRASTNNFSTINFLGRGGFGDVYKGILTDGKEVAVKRLSTMSGQGDCEFENEVLLLARLQHMCLVKLLGFCLDKKERLLVYELMENGSLDNILFDEVNRTRLDWKERYRIINSVAKGLLYLHEDSRLMIIHRDLKASNILLDGEMNAKISDFGMARLYVRGESKVKTRKIVGTYGYMAPEYAMHGLFSMKSDVYSYGVLFLEIISGKRNDYSLTEESSEGLLSYVYKTWKEGRAFDLIDPIIRNDSHSIDIMMRCIHVALLCVQENVGNRPTMATVIQMQQTLTIPLPLPYEPGFFIRTTSSISPLSQHSTTSTTQSKPQKLLRTTSKYDPSLNEDTDSYLYPR